MRIDKITLTNFLSHEHSEIQFMGEINVIVGQNGAGKSSIIDGIVFSLFRTHSRGNNDNLIRKGSNRGSVTLYLSNEKDKIEIIRDIRSTTEDRLIRNQFPIARSATVVSNEIEKILGIDKDIALSTIIVRQGELDKILENFQEIMGKILKLELIEKLIDSRGPIVEFRKNLENKLRELDRIEQDYNNFKKTVEEKRARVLELKKDKEKLEDEIKNLEKRIKDIKDQFDEYEKKRNQYLKLTTTLKIKEGELNELNRSIEELRKQTENMDQLEKEINELENLRNIKLKFEKYEVLAKSHTEMSANVINLEKEIEEYEKAIRRKEELEPKYLKYKELERKLEELQPKYQQYLKLKSDLDSKLNLKERLEKDASELSNDIDKVNSLEQKVEETRKKQLNLRAQLAKVESLISEKNEIINNISQVEGETCPVCGRPLDEEHKQKIIKEAKSYILQLELNKNELEEELKKITNELNKIEREYRRLSNNKASYDNVMRQLKKLNEEIENLHSEIESLKNIDEEIKKINEEVKELKLYYEEFMRLSKYTKEELDKKRVKLDEMKKKKEEIEKEMRGLESELKGLDRKALESKILDLENKRVKLDEMKKKKGILEDYIRQVKLLQEEVKNLREEVNIIQFDENRYNELKTSLDAYNLSLKEKENRKSRIEGELESLEKDIEEISNRIANYELQLKDREKIINAINKLEKIRSALGERKLQSYIIMTTKQLIENNLNDIISKFDLSIKNVEMEIMPKTGRGRSSSGDILVYTNSGDTLPIVSLSGGERIALSIALRLAIAKALMSNTNFFILDEPTIHLDDQRKAYLIEIIRAAKESVPQIIVVTHDEEVVQAADYVIRVEKRGNKSFVREET
ncbi:SMC family ATPase [Saccharolobus solfataricus]|uniref:DNA double-strand break repair Rad50 ATPase n=3 Tax=Saccharolobus solfataricus TaxID=2287 RepID=RAD50_SACS2|nr:SMC family ATPase [Saccharolobus solfataricus]Q97WH0.1 RecName: Full=DNA double-strand break repair Rad50 ATPase [Saccharolobus solfataricus P2]AAK42417.1 Purine NTPase [Saccharolobus solfataricus P2]AKA72518.1 SMC family ATPase [Saccharolobus solfataricus]AKA75217.1 SMC family ATPase [Saccharolobus solfataricus]AKA77910.1 SMC family ATPase [Saccharolobus solfataricus]AZF67028.1 SMC family ATPase [Saccharolobus solfataricus]